MGAAGGPNLVTDNLIFGYDTGYGIASRDISTRFYPGMPTSNVITDVGSMDNWTSYSNGNDGTFTTEFGTTGYRITNRFSWNGVYKNYTLPSTGTYSFSAWFRYWTGTASNNGATVYVNSYGGPDTATAINKSIIGEWQRIERVVNVTDTTVRFYLISYGGNSSVDRSTWDVTMPQIEKQSTKTPFINGTRLSTQSLIDLTRTRNIDVSNLSFNSTGQPTFDGTDDYINLGDSSIWDFGTNGTIETLVKPTNSTGNDRLWCIDNNSSNLDAYLDSSGYNVYMHGGVVGTTTSLTQNQYNHLVVVYNSGTVQIYVNGVAGTMIGTTTGYDITNNSTNNSNLYLGCYRNLSYNLYGDMPVFKIYNRALSADEVQQNYNAYKNRFNI